MLYLFSKCNEGSHMTLKEGAIKPVETIEQEAVINGQAIKVGAASDTLHVESSGELDRKSVITFVKLYINSRIKDDWWRRNVRRLDILEELSAVATV